MPTAFRFTCASCNLRYDEPKDPYPWQERKKILAEMVLDRRPDFLATQEGWRPQLYELFELLKKDYQIADTHRSYRDQRMYPALFIKRDWQIQHSTDRWLSQTPTIMGSTSFGSRWPKLAVFAQVNHAQHPQSIHLCSFHLDNVSHQARPQQAQVILKQLEGVYPSFSSAFLMGDANDEPSAPSIQNFLAAGFQNAFEKEGPLVTYHDFGNLKHAAHIDYIFYQSDQHTLKQAFLDDRKNNFYSDHYFLSATFEKN